MINCAFCGCANDPASKFCVDCGKPVAGSPSRAGAAMDDTVGGMRHMDSVAKFGVPATRVSSKTGSNAPEAAAPEAPRMPKGKAPCRYCQTPIDPSLPFCPKCGGRVALGDPAPQTSHALCGSCGNPVTPGTDVFCARCGARVAMTAAPPTPAAGTAVFSAAATASGPKIAILDVTGAVTRTETLSGPEVTVGRADGELRFPDDAYMSPVHAQLSLRDGQLFVGGRGGGPRARGGAPAPRHRGGGGAGARGWPGRPG
ncbi:MAG: zinc ribbon domain-containing protein, partial [Gemmatimonadales bacterium]|nr:zinc ribbon domain-containing protein [Gemmatimonadales bacterium]